MKKFRVAVLGATGAVGQEFLSILEERKFPVSSLKLLSSKRSRGKKVAFLGRAVIVEEAGPASFEGMDLVLSSAGSAVSRALVPHAVKAGAFVVDNTSAFRMDPKVPLVIPEINPGDIARHQGVVANPNCSTVIMLVPLYPIHKAAAIRRIVAATYQSASGAGARAMQELREQTHQVLRGEKPTKAAFRHQIAFNLFSHDSPIGADGFCEEEIKMAKETKKILHDEKIEVVATTVRVPVLRAHSEALFVELEKPLTVEKARELLRKAPGVAVVDDPKGHRFPMPVEAEGRDEILAGRIRRDPTVANGLALFVSGDQLRKGAALNAIQIAELWARNA